MTPPMTPWHIRYNQCNPETGLSSGTLRDFNDNLIGLFADARVAEFIIEEFKELKEYRDDCAKEVLDLEEELEKSEREIDKLKIEINTIKSRLASTTPNE